MLVTTKEMLLDAQKNHYAVGAFNVENLEFVMAVLAAAEETKSPVIMQTTSGTIKKTGLDYFYGMVKAAAERASVPVALHLDHGDGYDRCMKALRTGYTSVMIDGSHESFEDNIALTKSVADAGACMGVPVEAELGKVGGKEDDVEVEGESPYTDPVEAKEFVERTGCTSLAIGVGTAHGVYTEEPHIDQDVVKAIRAAVDVPLVLHGTPACRTSRSPRPSRTASARSTTPPSCARPTPRATWPTWLRTPTTSTPRTRVRRAWPRSPRSSRFAWRTSVRSVARRLA